MEKSYNKNSKKHSHKFKENVKKQKSSTQKYSKVKKNVLPKKIATNTTKTTLTKKLTIEKRPSKDIKTIDMIQWYYRYLYLASFLGEVIRFNDLSEYAQDISLETWSNSIFTLKWTTIRKLLQDIYKNPNKQNIFWYFNKIIIFEQITSWIRELIDNSQSFKEFLQKSLGKQYFDFEQIIRFIRNALSHASDVNIMIKKEYFEIQKKYLYEKKYKKVCFDFKYSLTFQQIWKWNKSYGLKIDIDFEKMKDWNKFFDIISLHNMFLLSELCFNLCEIYKKT